MLLIPVTVLFTVFGPAIGTALFGLRSANLDGAAQLGAALAVSAFGLVPFAITMLQMRVFYAMTDSRTPTLIQLVTVAVKVPLMLLCRGAAAAAGRRARAGRGEQPLVRGRARCSARCCCAAGWAGCPTPGVPGDRARRGAAGRGRRRRWLPAAVLALLDLGPLAALAPLAGAWAALVLAVVTRRCR